MNDIEVLEELIKNEHGELLNCWDYGEEAKQAIENLLKERQSDKERIKELEKENESLVRQYEYQGALMVNEYFSKDQVFKLFVPTSLIKEKIEEYKAKRKKYYKKELSKAQHTKSMKMWGAIQVLEELLKGE